MRTNRGWILVLLGCLSAHSQICRAQDENVPAQNNDGSLTEPASAEKQTYARKLKKLLRGDWLPKAQQCSINQPSDLIDRIPILRDFNRMVPRKFSLARHKIRFINASSVVIEKEFLDARDRSIPRNSIISFTYSGALGSSVSTFIEVPLFYSSFLGFTNWNPYSMGNYTITVNREISAPAERYNIVARARF